MEIEFVNHASVIFHHEDIHLITDPWLVGAVFHDGWDLLAPTTFQFSDFGRINYIWFSHEHPDHFYPPNIKRIDEKYRNNITVLFQKTKDQKVVEFLRKLNFKEVIELENNKWQELRPDFKVLCNSFGHDSWMCIKQGKTTILNTNDCVINTAESAKEIHSLTGDISVLLTQFSYGQYEGNRDEPHKRIEAVERKFRQMDCQISTFRPKYLLPMASFIYFCHEENSYANDQINKVGAVYDYYREKKSVQPVVLFLGDKWDVSKEYNSTLRSIEAWEDCYRKIQHSPDLIKTKKVSFEDLAQSWEVYCKAFESRPTLLRKLKKTAPLVIFLVDYNLTYTLSFKGFLPVEETPFHIAISSEVINYCMRFEWGFNTTHVNGRIQFSSEGMDAFLRYESLSNLLNHQEILPSISDRSIAKFKRIINNFVKK